MKTLFKYNWLKDERDKKIEQQEGLLFEENKWDGLWLEGNEWDGLWFEENEWDRLWFEGNKWYCDKSRGDARMSDDVMMEHDCHENNNRTERWSKS